MATTSADQNKDVIEDYLAAWAQADPEAMTSTLAADFHTTVSDPTGDELALDVEGFQQLMREYLSAFADPDHEVHEMVAEGDRVMVRITWRGTHQGEFLGIESTGNRVEVEEYLSFRLDDGAIVDLHALSDNLDLLRQFDVDLPIEG